MTARHQLAQPGGWHGTAHVLRRLGYRRARSVDCRGAGVGMGHTGQHRGARFGANIDEERMPLSADQLGQRQVVAGAGRGPRPHGGAEARLAGLGAVHRDDEHGSPACRVPRIALAAAEHLVLDLNRAQVTRAHAEERQPRRPCVAARIVPGLLDLEAAIGQARGPQLLPGRMQELLPRSRPSGVAERCGVIAAAKAVPAWL
jgi:hypothetical protein